MLNFERIQRDLNATGSDFSLNVDNQRVQIGHNQGTLRHATRTVYRVTQLADGSLVGVVLLQGNWERYEFHPRTRVWTPAPVAPQNIPIDHVISRAEKNLRDLTRQELYRLRAHYDGHKHHWRAYAVALELTYRCKEFQALAKLVPQCPQCAEIYTVESASYLFRTGRCRCPVCQENVKPRYAEPSAKDKSYQRDRQRHRTHRRRENWGKLTGRETEGF